MAPGGSWGFGRTRFVNEFVWLPMQNFRKTTQTSKEECAYTHSKDSQQDKSNPRHLSSKLPPALPYRMAPPDADVSVRAVDTPVPQTPIKGVHEGPDGTALAGEIIARVR